MLHVRHVAMFVCTSSIRSPVWNFIRKLERHERLENEMTSRKDILGDFSSVSANEIRERRPILLAVSLNNAVMKCSADRLLFPHLLESPVYSNLSLFIIAVCNERQNITINFQLRSFQHYQYQESCVIVTSRYQADNKSFRES